MLNPDIFTFSPETEYPEFFSTVDTDHFTVLVVTSEPAREDSGGGGFLWWDPVVSDEGELRKQVIGEFTGYGPDDFVIRILACDIKVTNDYDAITDEILGFEMDNLDMIVPSFAQVIPDETDPQYIPNSLGNRISGTDTDEINEGIDNALSFIHERNSRR